MSWINGWTTPKETPKAKPEQLRAAFEAEQRKKSKSSAPPAPAVGRPQGAKTVLATPPDEVDLALDDLERTVGELKQQASQIGEELTYSTHLVERLNTRVDKTTARVRKDNDRIVRLT